MNDRLSALSVGAVAEPSASAGRCATIAKGTGLPCRGIPAPGKQHCPTHDAGRADRRQQERIKGGQTTAARKAEAYRQVEVDMRELSSKAAIRRILSDLLQSALEGRLPSGRVQNITALLSLAARLADDAKPPDAAPTAQEPLRIELKDFTNSKAPQPDVKMYDCPSPGCDGRVPQGARQCPACLEPLAWKRSGE